MKRFAGVPSRQDDSRPWRAMLHEDVSAVPAVCGSVGTQPGAARFDRSPMNQALSCLVLIIALAVGCTRENAAFCCIDPADCAAQGVQEASRPCRDGLSCVENKCVASTCAASGCASTAPICEVATDTCVGCTDSTDCMRFPSTDVCDVTSGSCVECVSAMDCDAGKPICDGMVCRTCKLDSECPSGACADDGTCVTEANVVYLSPTGTDVIPCSKTQPCVDLQFAVRQANNARNHLVFAPGSYTQASPGRLTLGPPSTSASSLSLHGGGATVSGGNSDGGIFLSVPTMVRDLTFSVTSDPPSTLLTIAAPASFDQVAVNGPVAIQVTSQLTARRLTIRASQIGIVNAGVLTLDQATIQGGVTALESTSGSIAISNVLISRTSGTGIRASNTSGTISFSTIVDTGAATTTEVPGLSCGTGGLSVRSSIVWAPTTTSRPVVDGSCTFSSSIVGPVGVVGAMAADPLFADPLNSDYHLSGGSPARDGVDSGPSVDFEGDQRPRGTAFDIGADEAL